MLKDDKVTKHKIEEWLKSDHINKIDVDNAVEVIWELADGQYTISRLRKDVIEYYNGNWKYKEDE